jgi:hypothetical protein
VPDAAALTAARRDEAALLAAYDAQIRTQPAHKRAPLQVERAIHATHLAALQGPAASARRARASSDIAGALHASTAVLRRAALAATDGNNAALFASIAASHLASGT